MQVAICLSGTTKCHENSLRSIEKFFKKYNTKIFIHTYDNNSIEDIIRDSWSKKTAYEYYSNLKLNTKEILRLYFPTSGLIEDYNEVQKIFLPIYIDILMKEGMNMFNSASNLGPISMHYSIMNANYFKHLYEKQNNMRFDVVIRMRFDSDIIDMKPLEEFDLTKINIPIKRDWDLFVQREKTTEWQVLGTGGLNDQFAFGPSKLMDTYSSLFPVFSYFAKLLGVYQPETIFKTYLESCNVLKHVTRPKMLVEIASDVDYSSQRQY